MRIEVYNNILIYLISKVQSWSPMEWWSLFIHELDEPCKLWMKINLFAPSVCIHLNKSNTILRFSSDFAILS